MSPEQLDSSRHVDARSDVYALGVILNQVLAGRLPYEVSHRADLGPGGSGGGVARLAAHEQEVRALAWSGDGTALASASGDGMMRIWDTVVPEE